MCVQTTAINHNALGKRNGYRQDSQFDSSVGNAGFSTISALGETSMAPLSCNSIPFEIEKYHHHHVSLNTSIAGHRVPQDSLNWTVLRHPHSTRSRDLTPSLPLVGRLLIMRLPVHWRHSRTFQPGISSASVVPPTATRVLVLRAMLKSVTLVLARISSILTWFRT